MEKYKTIKNIKNNYTIIEMPKTSKEEFAKQIQETMSRGIAKGRIIGV